MCCKFTRPITHSNSSPAMHGYHTCDVQSSDSSDGSSSNSIILATARGQRKLSCSKALMWAYSLQSCNKTASFYLGMCRYQQCHVMSGRTAAGRRRTLQAQGQTDSGGLGPKLPPTVLWYPPNVTILALDALNLRLAVGASCEVVQ